MTAVRQQFLACLILVLLSVPGRPALAQERQVSEVDVKTAFLLNFTKFVEWPASAFSHEDAPFIIGVLGGEEFAAALRTLLQDKRAHRRPFKVNRLKDVRREAKECHILFFRDEESRRLSQVYDTIKLLPIMTIGESQDFIDHGGMLNLFFEDTQLRFEINPAAAENARLTVSSQLLRLARRIRREGVK